MANPPNPAPNYTRIPGVVGVACCSENSDSTETAGVGAEALEEILMYLRQTASLIGEAFGLEGLSEVQIQSKVSAALCLPRGGETIGLLLAPATRPADIIAKVAKIRGEL
ncbi:MAG TPA: hypothetical protein VK163_12905 [Opitutaceae bacterium]|nr:hypothetical protein [Opitutaceae bacterium]